MPVKGRRITARTRHRAGNLMESDETLVDSVEPLVPGSEPETSTDPTWIDVEVGLSL